MSVNQSVKQFKITQRQFWIWTELINLLNNILNRNTKLELQLITFSLFINLSFILYQQVSISDQFRIKMSQITENAQGNFPKWHPCNVCSILKTVPNPNVLCLQSNTEKKKFLTSGIQKRLINHQNYYKSFSLLSFNQWTYCFSFILKICSVLQFQSSFSVKKKR